MKKANWTAEQADFIKDNLEYLSTSCYTKMLNPLEMIYFNKLCCEEGDFFHMDDYNVQVYIGGKTETLFSILTVKNYDEFKEKVINGLAKLHLTLHEFRELKSIDILGNLTERWYKYTKDGISFTLQSGGDLPRLLTFMEKVLTGDEKSYEKIDKEYRYQYGYDSDEFTYRDMTIKTFKNGRVDIKNCPTEIIDKFFRYEQLFLQVYPDWAWSYKKFVEENKPIKVLEEYLC